MSTDAACWLALHLSHQVLNTPNERILENSATLLQAAQIILGIRFEKAYEKAQRYLTQISGAEFIVTHNDNDFPARLREIPNAPFALFCKGNRAILNRTTISIVGTREPSPSGRLAGKCLSEHFAKQFVIVSGIARGIDAIAHHAALQAGGATIAVLPNGHTHHYPLENRDLYQSASINHNILLVSEYPPEAKPQKHHYVRRNRIISGFSETTIFVEGAIKSGAMITARYALDQGRDVAALTLPLSTLNSGGLQLLEDGAKNFDTLVAPKQNESPS